MSELLDQFLIEGRELVAQAHADLARLAAHPTDRPATESAFRAIHTLKGSVGIFDMMAAGRVLHAAEDVLERARKSGSAPTAAELAALVACMDQTDRWIDEMERQGALSVTADQIALQLLAELDLGEAGTSGPSWLAALHDRHRDALRDSGGVLVAFRYAPDAECFFRGEDPLAIVASVPDLAALSIEPAPSWPPPLPELEPFRCGVVLLGFSRAAEPEVRAAFRLVSDQVATVVLAAAEEAAGPIAPTDAVSSSVRVSAARLHGLADGVGELVVAVHGLSRLAERADPGLADEILGVHAAIDKSLSAVRDTVTAMRLVPLAPVLRRFPRLVREIARALGKEVRLDVSGDSLEVDKHLADGLFEPLLHLVRNGVDHGLEPEAARLAAGKPGQGQLSITASREGQDVLIEVADDGRGIDPARVREAAVCKGLIRRETAEALSDAEALRLIFLPGFSTAPSLSDVSGRGIGLDAVQAAVERMRGRISTASAPGQGTCFRMRFPAQAITTPLLLVQAGGDTYGIPFEHVVETVRVDPAQIVPVGAGRACVLHGRTVPVLDLADLLGSKPNAFGAAKLLVTHGSGGPLALRVDEFGTRMDARIRPRGGMLRGVPGVSGTTLLPDGGVLLVLDLPELAR